MYSLVPSSGITTYLSDLAYFVSHLMPISGADVLSSAGIAPIPFSYPFSLAAILALAGIAPIPFSCPFSLAAVLASADIALIPSMYPLMPRYECNCEIVDSSILLVAVVVHRNFKVHVMGLYLDYLGNVSAPLD